MPLPLETLDDLIKDCKSPEDVGKLYSQMLQRMINRSLSAELDAHLAADNPCRSDKPRQPAQRQEPQDRAKPCRQFGDRNAA